MTDDAAFLEAIRAAPADPTPRLVYADWLDERGEFLRLQQQIADAQDRITQLRGGLDPEWEQVVAVRYDLIVDEYDPRDKISLIVLVRKYTGLGLAEAKEVSERLLPAVMVSSVPLTQAYEMLPAFDRYARVRLERTAQPKQ